MRAFFVAGVVSDCSGGLADEAAYSFSVAEGGLAEAAANTPLAALQIRVFLVAGSAAAEAAAVVVMVLLRALVGGPSLACLAALFELAAI